MSPLETNLAIEPHWTRERLHELIEVRLAGWKIIVVSNREPYLHRHAPDGGIECIATAGGLATALRPVLVASGGTWIAHGAGDADRETADASSCLMVPPGIPAYQLRRVWLTAEQEQGFYLMRARALLVESSTAISAVAEQSGFSSITQFYAQFRAGYGISPAALRQHYIQMDLR